MEPTYFVDTAFSGVGFRRPGEPIPETAVEVAPEQVDPEVRAAGRTWLEGQTQ